jgi:hypothetical protein
MIPLHVGGVQSLRPLLTLKLNGLAFVEALIAVFLDRGEMDKDVFPGRTLNEAIALGPIEPLHYTVLPHCDSSMTASLTRIAPENTTSRQMRASWALRQLSETSDASRSVEPKTSKETAFRNLLQYRLMALPIFYDRKRERWQEKFRDDRRQGLGAHQPEEIVTEAVAISEGRSVRRKAIFGPAT